MIKQFLTAILIAFCITLWWLQNSIPVQRRIGEFVIQAMQTTFNCRVSGHVKSVSWFPPTLEYENIGAYAHNDQWSWQAQRLAITISWIDLLFHKTLSLYLDVDACRVDSAWHGTKIGFKEFIEALCNAPPIKLLVALQSLCINKGLITLYDRQSQRKATSALSSNFKKIGTQLRALFHVNDVSITHHNNDEMRDGEGTISLHINTSVPSKTTCSVDYHYVITAYPHTRWSLTASWDGTQGIACNKSTDNEHSLVVRAKQYEPLKFSATFESVFALSLAAAYSPNSRFKYLSGKVVLKGSGTNYPYLNTTGWLELRDVAYNDKPIADVLSTTFNTNSTQYSGALSWIQGGKNFAHGPWNYQTTRQQGTIFIKGTSDTSLNLYDQWHLDPQSIIISATGNRDGIAATYQAAITHATKPDRKNLSGNIAVNHECADIHGTYDEFEYAAHLPYYPVSYVHSVTLQHAKTPLLTITATTPERIHATMHLKPCMPIIHALYKNPIQTDGTLEFEGLYKHNQLYAAIHLQHGAIRVPQIHNVIKDFVARVIIDPTTNSITMQDATCALHRGDMSCDRAVVRWNDQRQLCHVHVPLTLNNCFVNCTKDLFAVLSGYLVASWDNISGSHISGSLFMDKAQLKYNLFSSQLSQHLFSSTLSLNKENQPEIACDLSLNTKNPLRVKTAFLETDIKLALKLTGNLRNPAVTGSVELLSGEFKFPYKSLYITKGSLLFSSNTSDPTLYLYAKNTIKNYYVNLHITGSLMHPKLFIESSPHLSETQIFSLLLVGTEHDSLSFAVPVVLANNLKNLLFGADQTFPTIERYMHRFLKPLRSIHVMPVFTDKSGRGGLRGAIEVAVSDRLRAYLQKNFSLSEDTRIEVDYTLSDEMRIKGVRDEHGDIGAEVEMRWKF